MHNNNLTTGQFDNLRVALVHDFLTQYGGAERVLEAMMEIFPDAPIYTILYDKDKMRGKFSDKVIRSSFLQKFPGFLRKRYKYLLPLMPVAPETFDLRDFDLVITSSGAWSKGIITRLNTIHISYLHSPMRFVWDVSSEYLNQQGKSKAINFFSRFLLSYIRSWDKVSSDRPDYLISNSRYTQERVRKYYRRESKIIYPPVGVEHGTPIRQNKGPEESGRDTRYFLIVSRLSPYKKIDKAVEAFNKLELPLVVVGEGQQQKYLKSIANKNIKFLGWQSDERLKTLYSGARAFLFPAVDDFGIAPIEAMSYGIPVLAIRKGGVLETLVEGKTGEYFDSAVPEIIADCVRRFIDNEKKYDREYIKSRAGKFSKERFRAELEGYIENIISNFK